MRPKTAQRRSSCWFAVLALWLATACSQAETKLTQIAITVNADEAVAANLTMLEIATYAVDETDPHAQPITSGRLTLHAPKPAPGTTEFPFSLGVRKAKEDRFLLVITGFAGENAVIEQKARVAFVDGEERGLGIYLGSPCYTRLCGGPESSAWLTLTCSGGACDAVETPPTQPVSFGSELEAGLATQAAVVPPDASLIDDGDGGTDAVSDAREYALGAVGDACGEVQEQTLGCEAHASRQVVICKRGAWASFRRCAAGERCDSRLGPGQGQCLAVPNECSGDVPAGTCDGPMMRTCGIDRISFNRAPCPEKAHCDDSGETARCACDEGFETDDLGACVEHNDCPVAACQNGSCVDGTSDYSCNCNEGFAGTGTKSCAPVVHCPDDACTPGGTCVDVAAWYCHCGSGFTGEGTQACTKIDDCASSRCKAPNGTCQDVGNAHVCSCNAGFSGPDCLTDVCDPNPCQHDGKCTRTQQGASCDCGATGYVGAQCEDPRPNNPCATVRCKAGTHCEVIELCGPPSPCESTAVCAPDITGGGGHCGQRECAPGTYCCNPSCGICTAKLGACLDVICDAPPIAPSE